MEEAEFERVGFQRTIMLRNEDPQHRKLKILFVTNAFSYGGSEKHLLELVARFDTGNIQIAILCMDSDPFTERLGTNSDYSIMMRSERSLKTIRDWFQVFQESKPDVVVLVYGTLWMIPWIAAAAARLARVRRLYSIQHLMPAPLNEPVVLTIKTLRDVWRRLFGRRVRLILSARIPPHLCNKTICVSNAVRDALIVQYKFPRQKLVTVHNGIALEKYAANQIDRRETRSNLKILPDDFVLICTARLSKEKGIDILVLAMSQVVKNHPECKCIIVGEGYLKEELSKLIDRLGLGCHVFLIGFQANVAPYLSAADTFILTSYIEGLPFSVLEAMGCGLPCIVTNVGGNSEAVIHHVNGLVVNAGSVDDVVQAIMFLVAHPEERSKMAIASRARAESEFDIRPRMEDIKRLIFS